MLFVKRYIYDKVSFSTKSKAYGVGLSVAPIVKHTCSVCRVSINLIGCVIYASHLNTNLTCDPSHTHVVYTVMPVPPRARAQGAMMCCRSTGRLTINKLW